MDVFWIWLCLGIVLVTLEFVTGTLILLFFGLGSFFGGILAYAVTPEPLIQILGFVSFSLFLLFLFRKKLTLFKKSTDAPGVDLGQIFVTTSAIEPLSEATVSYQGTVWTAVNSTTTLIEKGSPVIVLRTEGIKLIVQPSNPLPTAENLNR